MNSWDSEKITKAQALANALIWLIESNFLKSEDLKL